MYIATLVLVAACDIQDEPLPATDRAISKSLSSDMRELQEIRDQVFQRLEERGVGIDEAQAVAESGDEAAARELLGMDDDEAQELYDRLVTITERLERGDYRGGGGGGRGGGIGDPDRGNPHVDIRDAHCAWFAYATCLAYAARGSISINVASSIIDYVAKSFLCMCGFCTGGINDYVCPLIGV